MNRDEAMREALLRTPTEAGIEAVFAAAERILAWCAKGGAATDPAALVPREGKRHVLRIPEIRAQAQAWLDVGMSKAEVARRLGLVPEAIYSAIHRGALRAEISPQRREHCRRTLGALRTAAMARPEASDAR